ncbi:MAG: ABC transporter ATP-binding protein [Candidatus Heimdallarchaeota archaeon]|nr:ABC transporter ATP-binding protein [Candidatus Heimdallarchaeota archaeon]MCK5143876.1 ABC transporter ATP-binding protein [Candidatus Heimdallarchaeota archaeon]
MIYFDKVTKIYQDKIKVVDDLSLTIEPEEFVSIVGYSGAGKTTLLKMFLAEETPTNGYIFFESTDINKIKNSKMGKYRQRIGTVFQDFKLLPNRTAYENVAFAMESAGKTDAEISSDVPHVLNLVDLGDKMWSFPRELSGGEQQRVAIARALAHNPTIIFADEPTGNLDTHIGKEIILLFKQLVREKKITVIMVTHDSENAKEADKILILQKGNLIQEQSKKVAKKTHKKVGIK